MFHVNLRRNVPDEEELKRIPAAFVNPLAKDPVFLDIHYHFKRISLHLYDVGSDDLLIEFWSYGGACSCWIPTFTYAGQIAMRGAIEEAVVKYKEEHCTT